MYERTQEPNVNVYVKLPIKSNITEYDGNL